MGWSPPPRRTSTRNSSGSPIARTEGGRLAFLGFSGIWRQPVLTPAPSTRPRSSSPPTGPSTAPSQSVKFKFWVRRAVYDGTTTSRIRRQALPREDQQPQGRDRSSRSDFTTDAFGGIDGEYAAPKDATLGDYALFLDDLGGGGFRVEEYKKPEFEVSVDAPDRARSAWERRSRRPSGEVLLRLPGDRGQGLVQGDAHVLRADLVPHGAVGLALRPGLRLVRPRLLVVSRLVVVGLHPRRAIPWWDALPEPAPRGRRAGRGAHRPRRHGEDLASTPAAAKAAARRPDHKYEITAEVVDASRRTIVGKGAVLVARKPSRSSPGSIAAIIAPGRTSTRTSQAQTLDGKPIKGKGKLTLRASATRATGKPTEEAVKTWDLDTDDAGQGPPPAQGGEEGQYRLSYMLTEPRGDPIEGGYVFVVRGERLRRQRFPLQ